MSINFRYNGDNPLIKLVEEVPFLAIDAAIGIKTVKGSLQPEEQSQQQKPEKPPNGVCETIEKAFQNHKDFPQYKYLIRPIYKVCVEQIGPVAATAVSFLSADLLVHQLLPQITKCTTACVFSSLSTEIACNIAWTPWKTVVWMGLALPVMYAK
ncbi:MAG: hypothetical protein ACRDFB_01040, partial [Rhabdochlamydiaceae bacterium]